MMKSWQERLFTHSLMKKEKVGIISRQIDFRGKRVLDLGCAQGTVSYQLKKKGGNWIHSDLDEINLKAACSLLKKNIIRQSGQEIPVKDDSFDLVLALDILEHVADDKKMVKEIHRSLRPKGKVVISTPCNQPGLVLNRLKKILGLKGEDYGHVREGYTLKELDLLLKNAGFKVTFQSTYAKFLVEFFEIILNAFFVRLAPAQPRYHRSGSISPSAESDLQRNSFLFNVYTRIVYPIVYFLTRADKFLFFKTGYATLVVAEKS